VHCAQLILNPSIVDVRRIKLHQCFANIYKKPSHMYNIKEKCIKLIVKNKIT